MENIKCGYSKRINKLYRSLKHSWKQILNEFSQRNIYESIDEDPYFEEIPLNQTFLTDFHDIFSFEIEFSNYNQISYDKINIRNIYDCFHGILSYIYYYSNNKLNIKELEFHFSGSKSNYNYSLDRIKNPNIQIDGLDILSIFEYENISTVFQIKYSKKAFFGVTFKRIKVYPLAYAIRSGANQNHNSHLVSFSFEGFDEESQKWDVLDERENNESLIANGSFMIFFVKKTQKPYSSFKLKQTSPSSNGIWGFSIAAFDIHGIVAYRENQIKNEDNFFQNEKVDFDSITTSYDPYIDMVDLI